IVRGDRKVELAVAIKVAGSQKSGPQRAGLHGHGCTERSVAFAGENRNGPFVRSGSRVAQSRHGQVEFAVTVKVAGDHGGSASGRGKRGRRAKPSTGFPEYHRDAVALAALES